MRTIAELLEACGVFEGLSPGHLELVAGCGGNRTFHDGELLMQEGEPADAFYVVRHGTVALETYVPQRGALMIETLHDDDLLGWSWLVPPYLTHFDARALGVVRTVAFDGACLRDKCEADPALGYELMKRFAAVLTERLQATRIRLLDVYGNVAGAR
jgi:CRP/FNR family transcriptional regulator, cyclic AMP receptor protein